MDTGLAAQLKLYAPQLCRLIAVLVFYGIGIAYYSHVEGWSTTTCIYFTTVSVATVGYGHYVPTTDNARIFTCFYDIIGVILVLGSINDLSLTVFSRIQDFIIEKVSPSESIHTKSAKRIALSVFFTLFAVFFGTVFFCANEGWSTAESFYWVIITMLTVGYGDLKLKHESSQQFSIFFIFFVVSVFATAIHNISDSYAESRVELTRTKVMEEAFNQIEMGIKEDASEEAEANKFLIESLLKLNKIDQKKDIDPIMQVRYYL